MSHSRWVGLALKQAVSGAESCCCSLLAECTDGAGTLEWNTVMDTFVALHTDVVGVVTGSPADDIIFVGDKENSNATLLRPGGALCP